ncbi:MAG: HAD hydrolase-like protein, partial [Rhodospirillales bacterium]|nr:HAD hydrolase-like protein [Rhodospirillales bacterium]
MAGTVPQKGRLGQFIFVREVIAVLTPTRRHAVIFDLDGTLIDSLPDLRTALNHLLEAEGRKSLRPEDVRLMVGDGAMRLVERAFLATGPAP